VGMVGVEQSPSDGLLRHQVGKPAGLYAPGGVIHVFVVLIDVVDELQTMDVELGLALSLELPTLGGLIAHDRLLGLHSHR
jgi:hypothetical protein